MDTVIFILSIVGLLAFTAAIILVICDHWFIGKYLNDYIAKQEITEKWLSYLGQEISDIKLKMKGSD